jgi:flagellar basal-body rod protein FlgB
MLHFLLIIMLDRILNNTSIEILKKLQDYTLVKQNVVANNIANVETPGFRAKDVSFQEEFADALKGGDFEKAMMIQPTVFERTDVPLRNDGSNVNLDREMVELQKNKTKYDIYTEILRNRFKLLKDTIADLKA